MCVDKDFTGILRELIEFLERLREIKLPDALEDLRHNLLLRSKETLTTFTTTRRSNSPEAYLNMNVGLKGLQRLIVKSEAELQEYVGAEEPKLVEKHQDYYETFQEVDLPSTTFPTAAQSSPAETASKPKKEQERSQDNEDNKEQRAESLAQKYSRQTAAQTKSNCVKCGPLSKKEGKKLFLFEQHRPYWVGLVDSHLLIYGSDRESRPCHVEPIHGYMARPAPNALPRDPRRSESAFEVFRPGSRTLQFIARTPKDMEQWVAKICQVNGNGESKTVLTNILNLEHDASQTKTQQDLVVQTDEQCQDAMSTSVNKFNSDEASAKETKRKSNEGISSWEVVSDSMNPPPLPARTPRRLPSLPTGTTSSYKQQEEDEDDIYHKIEDLKGSAFYQNILKAQKGATTKAEVIYTYDDAQAIMINDKKIQERESKEKTETSKIQTKTIEVEETYDDIGHTSKDVKPNTNENQTETILYDDAESLVRKAEKTEELQKTPQKKSFLDRVRSRKESPRKVEKKAKRKTPTPPPQNIEELPVYDDASALLNAAENSQNAVKGQLEEELPEYNCPPPPRPIHAKSTIIPEAVDTQELYDDVGSCRERYKIEENQSKLDQQALGKLGQNSNHINDKELTEQPFVEEVEHYQTPRNEACQQSHLCCQSQQEELYDDIAILADFKARQRRSLENGESEDSRFSSSPEKKSWNRFVGHKNSKVTDSLNSEVNGNCNGQGETEECHENQTLIRMNTFQKLLSKMENSLGKASGRTVPPIQLNRPNVPSNT